MRMPSILKLFARLSKSVIIGGLSIGTAMGMASESSAQTNSQFVPAQANQIGRSSTGFQTQNNRAQDFRAPVNTNQDNNGFSAPTGTQTRTQTPRIQPLGRQTTGSQTGSLNGQTRLNQTTNLTTTNQGNGTQVNTRNATFRSYKISNSTSSAVSKKIKTQLGNLVEIVNDTENNRLIVNTTATNHRIVEQIIQGFDSKQQTTQTVSTIKSIRSFNVSTDQIRKAADELSNLYINKNRIIVAADETVGKLMVFSTEQDYEEIAAYLKRKGYLNVKKTRDIGKPGVKLHDLKNIGWRQLEQSIYQGWGNAIKIEISTDGAFSRIQIPTLDKSRSQIQIDRRNNRLQIEASGLQLTAITRLIELLDQPAGKNRVSIVKTRPDAIDQIQSTVSMYKFAALQQDVQPRTTSAIIGKPRTKNGVYAIYQDQDENNQNQENQEDQLGPIGRVEIITIPGTDIIILKGDPEDVARVRRLIEELEKTSEEYKPQIEVLPLKHVDNIAVQAIATEVYTNFYEPSLGQTSITALVKPNALLLVGTPEGVKQARELVEKLDVSVQPETEFKVFRIKHMSAVDLENRLRAFYLGQTQQGGFGANQGGGANQNQAQGFAGEGLATRMRLASDYRSNALFVHASPRDMAEITKFVAEIDVVSAEGMAEDHLKIIRLKNSTAAELAPVLQDILTGQLQGAGQSNLGNNQFNQQLNNLNNQQFSQVRSAMLALQSLDPAGKVVRSSILFDTRITADENSNSLIIKAPKESIPLIELLVQQLDKLPDVESRIKVFELENAVAPTVVETIQTLFETQQGGGGGGQGGGAGGTNIVPLETGGYDSTIVSLRLAADTRSNTVIAAGSQGDLNIIEALISRLDEDIESKYVHRVIRLQNVDAEIVQTGLSAWLEGRSTTQGEDPRIAGDGSLEAVKRAITVQAETETNSLIVSAHEDYIELIEKLIADIDFKKQVVIQAVIAEIALSDTFEFGIEWGVQDSLIFDRGLGTFDATAAPLVGFPFNQLGLGNDITAGSLGLLSRENVAGQVLSNLSIGRSNADLGYGGMVVSAGNESINVLLRALDDKAKVDVLSRPQITTMENIQAFVQVGQDLPYVTGSQDNAGGNNTTFSTDFLQLGVTLAVTPRVRPDGEIWLRVDVGNSSQSDAEGVVIQATNTGVITQPVINTQNLQTDVTARSGQTIVLGGLIQTNTQDIVRGIPFFSSIPGIGRLFRFESTQNARTELFIILRPIVLDSDEDRRRLLEIEASRMNWCISDVTDIQGPIFEDETLAGDLDTVYPDRTPTGYHKEADAGNRQGVEPVKTGSLAPLNGDLSRNQTPNRFNQAPLPNQNVFGREYRPENNRKTGQAQPTSYQQKIEAKKKGFFSFGKK